MVKKIIVSKSKKDGTDLESELYNIRHKQHIDAYVYELEQATPGQDIDLQAIYDLREGSYTIDIGEYWLDVDNLGKK